MRSVDSCPLSQLQMRGLPGPAAVRAARAARARTGAESWRALRGLAGGWKSGRCFRCGNVNPGLINPWLIHRVSPFSGDSSLSEGTPPPIVRRVY